MEVAIFVSVALAFGYLMGRIDEGNKGRAFWSSIDELALRRVRELERDLDEDETIVMDINVYKKRKAA